MSEDFALLDDSVAHRTYYFSQPEEALVAHTSSELTQAFMRLEHLRRSGLFLCGYVSYEAGEALFLQNEISSEKPLFHFHAFRKRENVDDVALREILDIKNEAVLGNLKIHEEKAEYVQKIEQIKSQLHLGNTYQVNYTLEGNAQFWGRPEDLYWKLRSEQPVPYGAYLSFGNETILSFSPELFIQKKLGQLVSRPMKGTLKKSLSTTANQVESFRNDDKIISENVMIVDLIRNDMNKIAHSGSVRVNRLFSIEEYKTVYQMVSEVECDIQSDPQLIDYFKALFPCGSITGAPKKRTMSIIKKLENRDRGIYTGAIGHVDPDGDFCFNVAIRTLIRESSHSLSFGVGGGILYESSAEEEFEECQSKIQFLRNAQAKFQLIETFLFTGTEFRSIDRHLCRLKTSAKSFGFLCDDKRIRNEVERVGQSCHGSSKIRVLLHKNGKVEVSASPLDININEEKKLVCMAEEALQSGDFLRRHKTSLRDLYEKEYSRAQDRGFYEAIFLNEKKNVVEASRHNVFALVEGRWVTPPITDGALPGIMREQLIDEYRAVVKSLTLSQLKCADKIVLCNSVRGPVEVQFQ